MDCARATSSGRLEEFDLDAAVSFERCSGHFRSRVGEEVGPGRRISDRGGICVAKVGIAAIEPIVLVKQVVDETIELDARRRVIRGV